ncbi:MAG: DUF2961 domain-containing protein [Planctomycetes bacterium]|nr:DUF2961 domain-containing protein [Planctomycetota bacterium]
MARILTAWLVLGAAAGADTITYDDLLQSMVDLDALAKAPAADESCQQFSSYDRRTRWDPEKKEIVGNDANGDSGHFLRVEAAGHVLADMEGPGVIMRIWSANAAGTIQIFIDGEESPRLAVEMQKLLGGKIEPLTEPIAGVRSRGWNLYLPIPYQKHCKVVVKDPGRMYHQVTYRNLPKDTKIESFRWPLPEAWVRGIERVKTTLANPGSQLRGGMVDAQDGSLYVPAGETSEAEIPGPLMIAGIEIKLDGLPEDKDARRDMLRRLIAKASWDGEKNAIWTPLGDLFGTAPDINPYPGYPVGIREDGTMYIYWPMPFRERAVLALENRSNLDVSGALRFFSKPLAIPADQMLYFHADWRYESPVTKFDWPLLESRGAGRYCGVALYVFNTRTGWWGEGDEKMWIDGENFPSTIGTGSEDYFGYAWCSNEPFFNAYHNQPLCEGPGNGNYSSVNRFQIPDNVPFHKSIRVTIEAYNRGSVTYAATTYWYGKAGATTDAKPVAVEKIEWPRGFKPFILEGAIEGESLKLLRKSPEYPIGRQDISGHGPHFSRGTQVWLRPTAAGATADFALPAKVKPGKYRLTLFVVCSWDYGIVEWSLNGNRVAGPIDAQSKEVVSKKVDGGIVEIREGQNVLSIKVTGKSEKSSGFYAGLDALKLEPVK